jgi:hypothetical protein
MNHGHEDENIAGYPRGHHFVIASLETFLLLSQEDRGVHPSNVKG